MLELWFGISFWATTPAWYNNTQEYLSQTLLPLWRWPGIDDSFRTWRCILLQPVLVYSHWGLLPDLRVTQRPAVHNCDPALTLLLVPSPSYNAPSQLKTNSNKDSSSSRTRCSSGARSHTSSDRPRALQGVSLSSFGHILSLQGSY